MSLTVKGNNKEFKIIPEGVHQAVCIWIYDLGTQHNNIYNVDQKKIMIAWEIPAERIEIDGVSKPVVISKKYTASLGKKSSLRKDLETWRGKGFTDDELEGFNLKNILGKSCQLQINHTLQGEKTYANVVAVISLPKGASPLKPENPVVFFDIEEDTDIPESTPEWIINIIENAPEYKQKGFSDNPFDEKGISETSAF